MREREGKSDLSDASRRLLSAGDLPPPDKIWSAYGTEPMTYQEILIAQCKAMQTAATYGSSMFSRNLIPPRKRKRSRYELWLQMQKNFEYARRRKIDAARISWPYPGPSVDGGRGYLLPSGEVVSIFT